MEDRAARGTGRTTRQMVALPDGGVYVVAHPQCARYCQDLLVRNGRRSDALKFVTLDQVRFDGKLRGIPRATPLDVDHHAWDVATYRQREVILAATSRYQPESVS